MASSEQFPAFVMIIRHGEKPGDPDNDNNGGPDLSILGSARAAALPSLFTPNPGSVPPVLSQLTCDLTVAAESQFNGVYGNSNIQVGPPQFPTPHFLFATASSKSSSRPVETITPTAQALQLLNNNSKLTINQQFGDDNSGIKRLTSEILQNPSIYGGQVVLIAWHHGTIPALTESFGVPASQLPWSKWPPTVFDLLFQITWPSNQANLTVFAQKLLYGDSQTPPQSS